MSMKSLHFPGKGAVAWVNANGTEFYPMDGDELDQAGQASEVTDAQVAPRGTNMKFVRMSIVPKQATLAATESLVLTIQESTDNGATWSDTSVTLTLDSGDSVGTIVSWTGSVTITKGALYILKAVRANNTNDEWGALTITTECDEGQIVWGSAGAARTANTDLIPRCARQGQGTTFAMRASTSGKLKLFGASIDGALGASIDADFSVRVSGAWDSTFVDQGTLMTISGATQQEDDDESTEVPLDNGDAFYFRVTETGSWPSTLFTMSCIFIPDTFGESIQSVRWSGNTADNNWGSMNGGDITTNANTKRYSVLADGNNWKIRRGAVLVTDGSDPGAGNTWGPDFHAFAKGGSGPGSAGGFSLVLDGDTSDSFLQDTSTELDVGRGDSLDLMHIEFTPTGTPDSLGNVQVSWVLFDEDATSSSPISAAIAGTSTVTGNLAGSGALAATPAGASTTGGDIAGRTSLSAVAAGAAAVAAILAGRGALASAPAGSSAASGTLAGTGALAGVAAGVGAVIASIAGKGALAAAPAGSSTTSGTLSGVGDLAAALPGVGAVVADLRNAATLRAALAGVGAVVADLGATASIAASLAGVAAIVANLGATVGAAAALAGAGAVNAAIAGKGALAGSAAGTSTTSATGRSVGFMLAAPAGSSSVTAVLVGTGALAATPAGAGTITASLAGGGDLFAALPGVGTLTATAVPPFTPSEGGAEVVPGWSVVALEGWQAETVPGWSTDAIER